MDRNLAGLSAIWLATAACGAPAGEGPSAMTEASPSRVSCYVKAADRLPVSSGGAAALCTAISDALRVGPAEGRVSRVDVQVRSVSAVEAIVTMRDGRRLDPLTTEIADGQVSAVTFAQLARDIVEMVARRDE